MDLDEWEILPDDGFLEIHDDGGKKIFSRKYVGGADPKSVFKTNYFEIHDRSQKISDPIPTRNRRLENQLVPVPIQSEQTAGKKGSVLDHELVKEVTVTDQKVRAPTVEPQDQDTVSQQVFFRKKENEFVDMKMELDSPKSGGCRGIVFVPQIEDRCEKNYKSEAMEGKTVSKVKIEKETDHQINLASDTRREEGIKNGGGGGGGLNLWKWSLNGIGAICSFGVAAATMCVIILGTHQRNNQHNHQKLQFQIYADEKRIQQVVHHATKLNEAMSAVRGGPLTRAHITIGGHYDGL